MKYFVACICFFLLVSTSSGQRGTVYVNGDFFPKNALWFNSSFPINFDALIDKAMVVAIWNPESAEALLRVRTLQDRLATVPQIQLVSLMVIDSTAGYSRSDINGLIQQFNLNHPIGVSNTFNTFKNLTVRKLPHFAIYRKSNIHTAQTLNDSNIPFEEALEMLINDKDYLRTISAWSVKDSIDPRAWANPMPEAVSQLCVGEDKLFLNENAQNRIICTTGEGIPEYTIGSGQYGYADGSFWFSKFKYISAIAYDDRTRQLFIADRDNHRIRVADASSDLVYTLLGDGKERITAVDSVRGLNTSIGFPTGLTFYKDNLYVCSAQSNELFQINAATGVGHKVFTFPTLISSIPYVAVSPLQLHAGRNGIYVVFSNGSVGMWNTTGWELVYEAPNKGVGVGSVWERGKRLYATQPAKHRVVLVEKGIIKPFSGTAIRGYANGSRKKAAFHRPEGLSFYQSRLLLADAGNHVVRALHPKKGQARTLAIAPSEVLMQTGDALNTGDLVYLETLLCNEGENTLTMELDIPGYELLPEGKNEVYVDEGSGTRLESNILTGTSWEVRFKVREQEPYLQFELYLTLRSVMNPDMVVYKKALISLPVEQLPNEENVHQVVYRPHLLPY
jgi:hypothetical protein